MPATIVATASPFCGVRNPVAVDLCSDTVDRVVLRWWLTTNRTLSTRRRSALLAGEVALQIG
jgi:hypothetical protein